MHALRTAPNRGQTHLFLGDPWSIGLDKTVVEPGNAFSPGLWTLGISLAVRSDRLYAPELMDLPIAFTDGLPPVVESRYAAGPGVQVCSRLCHLGGRQAQSADYFAADVTGASEDCCLVVRDMGPAGGRLTRIAWDEARGVLSVDDATFLDVLTPLTRVEILPADEAHDSPAAFLHFAGVLRVRVRHALSAVHTDGSELPGVEDAMVEAARRWQSALPARIFAPDARVERMWQQTAFHMQNAMECGLPRIAVENYPILWIRDCVIVLRALDLMGRHDLARSGCDYLAPLIFSGGFGCESDNPGEGIWALVHHALLTKDMAWLAEVFPEIRKRVAWLQRMLTTEETLYRAGDSRTVMALGRPDTCIVCYPHEGRHIHGRMDFHSPDFYINCWAYTGLALAAQAAEMLGREEAAPWRAQAEALDAALCEELLPAYGNERDPCVAPYPCNALSGHQAALREAFLRWYRAHRLDEAGGRVPEPLWTYFEAAQIHNALLLGLRDEAWACLDGFLDDPRWFGMSLMQEGRWNATEMLPFGNGKAQGRGWLREGATGANMPHNWTTSEAMLMLRSLLVVEEAQGLALLGGVPDAWLVPGARMGVERLPTAFGSISFTVIVDARGGLHREVTQGQDIPVRWVR